MMKAHAMPLVLALLLGAGALLLIAAGEPFTMKGNSSVDYARATGQAQLVTTEVDSGATQCLTAVGGGSTCAVFGWDSIVHIKSDDGKFTCCVTQQLTATLGTQSGETPGRITVGTNTEDCQGYRFTQSVPRDIVPMLENIRNSQFQRAGKYCKGAVRGFGNVPVHPPCTADADCSTLGASGAAGQCVTSSLLEAKGGAMIFCRATADNTMVDAVLDR